MKGRAIKMPKKLEDCVKKVKSSGKSESSAYAICNSALYGNNKPKKKKRGRK